MRTLIVFSCVFALVGCGPQRSRLELVDGNGSRSRELTIDFGVIGPGAQAERTLDLRNSGDVPIKSIELVHVEGAPVQFHEDLGPGEPFQVLMDRGLLAPGRQVVLRLTAIAPTEVPADGLLEATVLIRSSNSNEVVLHLRASVAADACAVPSLDFGLVRVGQSVVGQVKLDNPTDQPSSVIVGAVRGDAAAPDVYRVNGVVIGERTAIAPHASLNLVVEYAPNEGGQVNGILGIERDGCGAQEITLKGNAVDEFVTWSNEPLDCGYVEPGLSVTRPIELANLDLAPRTVELSSSNWEAFLFTDPKGALIREVTIPGATLAPSGERNPGIAQVQLLCRAGTEVGRRTATLDYESASARETGTRSASMLVGGAELELEPTSANFDTVAWIPGQPGWEKQIEIRNIGSAPLDQEDLAANLFLGKRDSDGRYGAPFFSIRPLNADTSSDEFTVELDGSYDPAKGLSVVDGPDRVPLHIRFTPQSLGFKAAQLQLFTSDMDEPVVPIILSANVIQLPSCKYSVSPATLDFGVIPPGETRGLSFTVHNDGTTAEEGCLLYPPQLDPGFFSMVNPPTKTVGLAAGQEQKYVVSASGGANLATSVRLEVGQISLRVSSASQPTATVGLAETRAPDCLRILWYGNLAWTGPSCPPAVKSLELFDRCPLPLTITGISLPNPAGQPAGGPNCSDPMGCPEFALQQVPTIPAGGLVMHHDSVFAQVSYAPIDSGLDEGLLRIDATIGGTPVKYVQPLVDTADFGPNATESFTAPGALRQNILVAVDDSSANQNLPNYQSNVEDFIQAITASRSDFRLAVVKCSPTPARFQHLPGLYDVVTRWSPQAVVEAGFEQAMNVSFTSSSSSDCAESLKQALASDNPTNTGFIDWNSELELVVLQHDAPAPTASQLTELSEVMGTQRAGWVHLSAVAQGSCAAAPSWQSAAAATGGVFVDDCTTSNWGTALAEIVNRPRPPAYKLTWTVDTSQPLGVFVKGALIAPVDANGDPAWRFDSATNSVIFEPNAAPSPGDSVEVKYTRGC